MLQTGPDGALWVADMYRHVIEHPEWIPHDWQKRLDLRAGHDKGRIYRVYPADRKPRPIPRLDKLDTPDLVAALDSPNGWQRDMAQQLLIERGDSLAVPHLQRLAERATRPQARLQALCTLDGLNALDQPMLWIGLGDTHPGVRRHAIRLSEPVLQNSPKVTGRSKKTLATVANLIDDPDPQVQMQLAYSLGEFAEADRLRTVAAILLRPDLDRFLRAAALSSVKEQNLELVLGWVIDHHQGRAASRTAQDAVGAGGVV